MKRVLFICSASFFMLCVFCGTVNAADMSELVQQKRQAAEQALRDQRAAILKQRQTLLTEFAELQQQLSVLKSNAGESAERLDRLQDRLAQRDQMASKATDALELTINRVSSALGVTPPDEFDAAICKRLWADAVSQQLSALDRGALLRIEQQEIADRNGEPVEARLIHCGAVQQLAVTKDAFHSGFVIQSEGGFVINGPLINEASFQELQNLNAAQGGFLIADLDGSLKDQNVQIETWSAWLNKGGFFIWPIIAVGILAFILACERIVHVLRLRIQPSFLQRSVEQLQVGDIESVKTAVGNRSNPLQRVLACGIEHLNKEQDIRESALEASLLAEEADLDRSRSLLAVLAAIAPLLGLLGTVTGMIATFQSIALYGTANPALLSNGISEALITTQMGLVVAVPILLVHGLINRVAEKRRIVLEQAAGHILSVQAP